MTVKALYKFPDGSYETMLFGDSYKTWRQQQEEWEDYGRKNVELLGMYKSHSKWVQNGLKWCDYSHYQEELDEEAKELDRKPRQLDDFKWSLMSK